MVKLILACKSEAPSKEECFDICGLWLLKDSSDAHSALQEKASWRSCVKCWSKMKQFLAEAAALTWIMMPFFEYLSSFYAVIIHDDGATTQGFCERLTNHGQILHARDLTQYRAQTTHIQEPRR